MSFGFILMINCGEMCDWVWLSIIDIDTESESEGDRNQKIGVKINWLYTNSCFVWILIMAWV